MLLPLPLGTLVLKLVFLPSSALRALPGFGPGIFPIVHISLASRRTGRTPIVEVFILIVEQICGKIRHPVIVETF